MLDTMLIKFPKMFVYSAKAIASSRDKSNKGQKLGRYLHKIAITGGPFYIKIGQIMSTRSDLLPTETIKHLQKLQDETPADDFSYIRATLEAAYLKPLSEVFDDFSEKPIASASIAQVHIAKLKTGEKVAVKVVKKGVERQMRRTLGFVCGMTSFAQRFVPIMKKMHAEKRVQEIRRLLTEQLDLKTELHNLLQVRNNFLNHEYIATPKPYPELSNSKILVMEFIEGIRGLDFDRVNVSPKKLAARLQNAIYTMLYFDGVCHGDPHPGNIIFSPDGKLTFVDFGIVAYLSEDEKWGLSSFYYAATNYKWDLAVRRFTKTFALSDRNLLEDQAYVSDMANVLRHHFQEVADHWNTAKFFQDTTKILHKHGASYTPNLTKAELAMMSCEGFATQMDPELDVWSNAREFSDQYSPFVSDSLKDMLDKWYKENKPRSEALRARGKRSLIASTHLDRYFFPANYPMFVEAAEGAMIRDADGEELIDLSCGYGPHILGYSHPVLKEALAKASNTLNINAMAHEKEVELAEKLVKAFPGSDLAVLSNSGTESVIHALRLCRAYRPKATKIAKFEGHYHGFSDQAMVSSWFRVRGEKHNPIAVEACRGTPSSVVQNTRILQFNHEHSLEVIRNEADDLAAVLLEPLQAGSGAIQTEYLQKLRDLCTEKDIPLIFDEVVTGFRVDYGGVQTISGIVPDLTCLGKIIGGGLPAGATVGKKHILELGRTTHDPFRDYEERVFLGGTMSGNYVSCSTGIAVLDYLNANRNIYPSLREKTDYLSERIRSAAQAREINIRLKSGYSMFGLTFTHKSPKFFREAMQGANFKATLAVAYLLRMKGVYMPELHGFLISNAHTMDHLKFVGDRFEECLQQMDEMRMFVR